jgi:hypothetical protein
MLTSIVSEPDGIENSYQTAGWSNGSYVSHLSFSFITNKQKISIKMWNSINIFSKREYI